MLFPLLFFLVYVSLHPVEPPLHAFIIVLLTLYCSLVIIVLVDPLLSLLIATLLVSLFLLTFIIGTLYQCVSFIP